MRGAIIAVSTALLHATTAWSPTGVQPNRAVGWESCQRRICMKNSRFRLHVAVSRETTRSIWRCHSRRGDTTDEASNDREKEDLQNVSYTNREHAGDDRWDIDSPQQQQQQATRTDPFAILETPVPFLSPPLAGIFPVILVGLTLVQPLLRVWFTTLLFGALRTVATPLIVFRETNLDDSDDYDDAVAQWQIDGTILVLSFFATVLIIPSNWSFFDGANGSGAVVAAVFGSLAILTAIQRSIVNPVVSDEQLSEPEIELNTWDEQFRRMQEKQQRKDENK